MAAPRSFARRSAVLAGGLVLLLGAGGCSSDPPDPTTAQLVAKLGILRTQQHFTPAQVRCVADHATTKLHGKALRDFADELTVLQSRGSASAMSPASLKVFTDAIAACAVVGN